MIKAEQMSGGTSVRITFSEITDLIEELTAVLKAVKNDVTDQTNAEFADLLISTCGKLAYAEHTEEYKTILHEMEEWLDKDIERRAKAMMEGGD